jgi:hypothetical protein
MKGLVKAFGSHAECVFPTLTRMPVENGPFVNYICSLVIEKLNCTGNDAVVQVKIFRLRKPNMLLLLIAPTRSFCS